MVDLFYDHFIAADWDAWSDEPFASWLARMRGLVEGQHRELPECLQALVPIIFAELLPSYREINGIGHALERMARRVRQPNPLAAGVEELVEHYEGLRGDFRGFVPSAQEFVRIFFRRSMPCRGRRPF